MNKKVKEIIDFLVDCRIRKNITQRQLGNAIRMSQQGVSQIETYGNSCLATLELYAQALNMNLTIVVEENSIE